MDQRSQSEYGESLRGSPHKLYRNSSQRSSGMEAQENLCTTHHQPMDSVLGVRTTSANIDYRLACPDCIRSANSVVSVKPMDTIERDVDRLTFKAKKSNYAILKTLLQNVGNLIQQISAKAENSDKETADWYNTALNIDESRQGGKKRHLVEYCCKEEAIKDAESRYDPRVHQKWVNRLTVVSEAIKAALEDRQIPSVQPKPSLIDNHNEVGGGDPNDKRIIEQFTQQNDELKRQLKRITHELKNLKVNSNENSELRKNEATAAQEIQRMKMIIEESKRSALMETQRLHEVIEELRKESSTLRYSSSKLEKANQELVTQLAQRTEDCDRTIKQWDAARGKILKLEGQIQAQKKVIKSSADQAAELKAQIKRLQDALKEERQASKLLQQQYGQLSRRPQPANDQRYREEVRALSNDILQKDNEITKLRELTKQLQQASTKAVVAPVETRKTAEKEYPNRQQRPESGYQQPQQSINTYSNNYSMPPPNKPTNPPTSISLPAQYSTVSSTELFKGSRIVMENGMQQKLLSYFQQVGVTIKNAIYIFEGYGKTVEMFHSACDERRNLLVLIQLKQGGVYGGFTENGWCKTNNYVDNRKTKSFLLNSNYDKIAKFNGRCNYPTQHEPKTGPQFGLQQLGVDKLNRGYCKKVTTPGDPFDFPDMNFFPRPEGSDTTVFEITAYEVWHILI